MVALMAVLAMAAAACSSSKKSSSSTTAAPNTTAGAAASTTAANSTAGNTASAPGITTDTITVGLVSDETGSSASNNQSAAAFKARIQAENDKGGIFGRKIKVVAEDGGSAFTTNLTEVQKIVQESNPFVMVDASAFLGLAARYLVAQKIPAVTGGYDGPQYANAGNEDLIPFLVGNIGKDFPAANTGIPQFMKDQGVIKGAGLGYTISPSSSNAAIKFANGSLPAVGLPKGYVNTSIAFGGENVTPVVLDMKRQAVDGAYLAMDNNTNFAVANSAVQNGLILKALVMATGYDHTLLDNPTTVATAEKGNVFISSQFAPYEANNPGVDRMRDVFQKYLNTPRDQVPVFGWWIGYGTAQLLIDSLKAAGQNPTRQGFVDGARSFDNYTDDGIFCSGVSYTMATYGMDSTKPTCSYFIKVANGKFVLVGKVPGHNIPPSA
jgi:ABC-type branched-subunit amino acid transport system substrate-binding protein